MVIASDEGTPGAKEDAAGAIMNVADTWSKPTGAPWNRVRQGGGQQKSKLNVEKSKI